MKRAPDWSTIASLLADASDERFYEGLALLRRARWVKVDALQPCLSALNAAPLPQRQIGLRATALLELLQPSNGDLISVTSHDFGLAVSNVINARLPPGVRRSLHARDEHRAAELTVDQGDGDGALRGRDEVGNDEAAVAPTVLMLTLVQKDADRNLLEKRSYRVLTVSDVARYEAEMSSNADICGVLIDGSFLASLDAVAQRELFSATARYSSFIWIRVEGKALKVSANDVRSLIRGERCQNRAVASHEISFQNSSLSDSELVDLSRASGLLAQYGQAAFLPGELSAMERRVLVAAVYEWQERTNTSGVISIDRIETRFIQGGFQTIRVASVLVNGARRPVIAKFSSKERLADELRRFQSFVQPIDNQVDPILGYHGDAAVLLVALVQREQSADEPAETLEEALTSLRRDSWGCADAAREELLFQAVKNAGYVLLQINMQPASAGAATCPVYMNMVESAERNGVVWNIDGASAMSRSVAIKRYNRMAAAAITHNDLHLRNVLVRGTAAHLIDYESCGAGHPAIDLVRLEVALFSAVFFPVASDEQHLEMQQLICEPACTLANFMEKFAMDTHPAINRLCIRAIFAVREYALKAVAVHGGDSLDYLAAKYLVGWQNLLLDGKQVSLTRSLVAAIAPQFRESESSESPSDASWHQQKRAAHGAM
jgi:hypothetical protein